MPSWEERLAALEKAVVSSRQALVQARAGQQELEAKATQYRDEAVWQEQQARAFFQKNQKAEASRCLERKAQAERQLAQYEVLTSQVAETVRQLERRTEELNLRIDEMCSRSIALKAQLQGAKMDQEIARQMGELTNYSTGHFREMEEEIHYLEHLDQAMRGDATDWEIEQALNSRPESVQAAPDQALRQLEEAISAEKRAVEESRILNANRRIEGFFGQKTAPVPPVKTAGIEDFFASTPDPGTTSPQQQADQFFQKNTPAPDKNQLLNDFFAPPKPEPDK
jgi:phage shock protein A